MYRWERGRREIKYSRFNRYYVRKIRIGSGAFVGSNNNIDKISTINSAKDIVADRIINRKQKFQIKCEMKGRLK